MDIAQIMTQRNKLVTTTADASLASLCDVFTKSLFQHVPVIDSTDRLVGIVSVKDYFKTLSPIIEAASANAVELFIEKRKVQHVMVTKLITVKENTSVKQGAALLLEHNISCLLVVNEYNHLLGIVSWKDIMRAALYKDGKSA